VGVLDEESDRYWAARLARAGALLFGRVTYEMMEGAWRRPATGDLGLIDEYEFLVLPVVAGHGPTLFAGLSERLDLKLVDRQEFRSGAAALRYEPARGTE
jgi:dihydrofolate reductase